MRRRRFLLAASSVAVAAPFMGLSGCGNASDDGPQPVPPSDVVLSLPKDMYLHLGAPTEWWWHIGTLRAGARTFGFEINTASFAKDGFAFSQIMLSDVANGRHYKRTIPFTPPVMFNPSTWAESDVSKDWFTRLGDPDNGLSGIAVVDPGSGYTSAPTVEISGGSGASAFALVADGKVAQIVVLNPGSGYTSPPTVSLVGGGGSGATARAYHMYANMTAPAGDPTQSMRVQALLCDDPSFIPIRFDLTFSQQGRPFFVWGTGVNPSGDPGDLTTNNYYFSLTRMDAAGTIDLDGERFDVEGVTWMDHEYGAFGTAANPVKWMLQDFQLDNGWCVSNYATVEGGVPPLGQTVPSIATVQDPAGNLYVLETRMTAIGRTWTSPETGATYFLEFRVEIPAFEAELTATALVDEQEFPLPGFSVYEGVAAGVGTFKKRPVTGTAWIEQAV